MKLFWLIWFVLFAALQASSQLKFENTGEGILISENGNKVLFYQTQNKDFEGKYSRCNYIHPLWAADGTVLTEDFPADHLHHRGIFWAWHQVWIGDKRIGDPWEIKNFGQKVFDVETTRLKNGRIQIKTGVDWLSDLWTKNNKKVPYITENSIITVHQQTNNYRRIDFEIRLKANEKDLFIGGSEDVKGYGGFSVRMKLPSDVVFSGKNGEVTPQNTAVESEGFIIISGSVLKNGKKGGIVMVDDSENPGYPQPWILRAHRSMQNAAYPGNVKIPVSTINPIVLKYSLIVFSGELDKTNVAQILHSDE